MLLTDLKLSSPEVAELTGLNPETLQTYIRRGLLVGMRDAEGGGAQGKHRRFSWYALMQVALGAELIRANVAAKSAFDAAVKFAHVSSGVAVWEVEEEDPNDYRAPGFPYRRGDTYLIAYGEKGRVVRSYDGSINPDFPSRAVPTVYHVVNATKVFERICGALGVHPYKELDDIYNIKG